MDVQVNLLAVFLAAVSTMVVGSIWYAKGVFGGEWAKMVKLSDKQMQEAAPKALALAFVASLVSAYVLAHVAYLSDAFFDGSFLKNSLNTAFWLWLGFTGARMLVHDLFERRPAKLTVMNTAHELVTLLVMGLVIGVMAP